MPNPKKQLIIVLLPDGRLQLEWEVANKSINKSSTLLEQEIFT
ncbi:hypothetical protein VT99_12684, partial [Candidatus Electrothrix marina]